VKITKDNVAAIQGSISYPSNLGTPKPDKNKSINNGTDWNNQAYEKLILFNNLFGIILKKVIKIPKIPPPTKAISDKYIVNLQAAINWDIIIPSGLPKMFINKSSITKLFYQVKF
jgi:hypothetical protein